MRSHERSAQNAKISISLSTDMLDQLDKLAKQEGRTRSNMLQRILAAQLVQRNHHRFAEQAAEPPDEPYLKH